MRMTRLPACANLKEPAEKAVMQAEAALAQFRADAQQFAAAKGQELMQKFGA